MCKLCLSTYLSVLTLYKCSRNVGQFKILNGLVKSLCNTSEIIDKSLVSYIKNGDRNLPRHITDEIEEHKYQNPRYLENFKSNVEIFLHPGKIKDIYKTLRYIAIKDDSIADEGIIDFVSQTKKNSFDFSGNYIDFIAGVFLYVIRLENDKTHEYAKQINENFCENAIKEYSILVNSHLAQFSRANSIIMDSDIPSQAKAFCRTYENSKSLLPLCQIANIVNPTHNHINAMYSAYCDCSDDLKKQIMQEIKCPIVQVDDEYTLYNLLGRFSDEIEALGLASPDKTYMFPQYVVKSLDFEELEPIGPDPSIFPLVPNAIIPWQKTSTLSRFIDDYLYFKDTDNALPIPFDWIWNNFDFTNCDCKDLILWLNLFIINCCNKIDKPTDNKSEKKESPVIPFIRDVKTIEDIHFLALLCLYDRYMCK